MGLPRGPMDFGFFKAFEQLQEDVKMILSRTARLARIFAFVDKERTDLLAQVALLNEALVVSKNETALALANDAADAEKIVAANEALADAQAARDEAVKQATEAGVALLDLNAKAAALQTLVDDDVVEDQSIDALAAGVEARIPETFGLETPVPPVEDPTPVEDPNPEVLPPAEEPAPEPTGRSARR